MSTNQSQYTNPTSDGPYNLTAAQQIIIRQFNKNIRFINSFVVSVSYRQHQICKHFQ